MSSQELPVVITAISDAVFESFVSGTLFAQGWSVIFRAIDSEALEKYCELNPEIAATSLLIFSPDLEGVTPEQIAHLNLKGNKSSVFLLHQKKTQLFRIYIKHQQQLQILSVLFVDL
ncbi:unannotated protein [freshwater metagenome]|uniref:Unannotated protein n=1 Tax=freshwater metagenome TaxID=449393 RepID=A0A6J6WFI3_9ZZZZ|nr:hypothetical protein [Actinomycetota bacterium]MTB04825.1 hypothetical protein [Actinomycetota bacterium]